HAPAVEGVGVELPRRDVERIVFRNAGQRNLGADEACPVLLPVLFEEIGEREAGRVLVRFGADGTVKCVVLAAHTFAAYAAHMGRAYASGGPEIELRQRLDNRGEAVAMRRPTPNDGRQRARVLAVVAAIPEGRVTTYGT